MWKPKHVADTNSLIISLTEVTATKKVHSLNFSSEAEQIYGQVLERFEVFTAVTMKNGVF
jgi:hypothetical protein